MDFNSDFTSIINKLNHINADSIIELNNGITIKLSDIKSINNPITLGNIYNAVNNLVNVSHSNISLEKFIQFLKYNKISSSSLNYEILDNNKEKRSKASKNFSKWVYNLIIFKPTIQFTVIEKLYHNEIRLYIPESFNKINSLINFINNKEPIYDLFGISNSNVIWWNDLDKKIKEQILSFPISIVKIYPYNKDKNMDKYSQTINLLY